MTNVSGHSKVDFVYSVTADTDYIAEVMRCVGIDFYRMEDADGIRKLIVLEELGDDIVKELGCSNLVYVPHGISDKKESSLDLSDPEFKYSIPSLKKVDFRGIN